MRNECNIIRDILPLYIEGMVSDDTVSFAEEHLAHCPACQAYLAKLKAPTEIDDRQSSSQAREKEALPLKILIKKLKRKRILTGVISAILAIVVLIGGFVLLTQPELIPVSDSDITVEQVYRFDTEDGPRFFVLYTTRYSGHRHSEYSAVWDEYREAPTLILNEKRAILNLWSSGPEIQNVFFADAGAYDTKTWDDEAQDFRTVDYTTVKFGNTVIWTDETDGAQEVPEYVYVLYDMERHPEQYTGVAYGSQWLEIQYADGHAVRWDYDGNRLSDTSENGGQ